MADSPAGNTHGVVYTPSWLVALVLQEIFKHVAPQADRSVLTVCDPTCGDGSFLVGARDAGIMENHLYGVDRDPAAIAHARRRLPGANLVSGEALLGVDWDNAFARIDGVFDILIGNPPYVRIQHLVQQDPGLAAALSSRHPGANGNFDLYVPLIELAFTRMRLGAGFIVPQRFFATEYGRRLRAQLAQSVASIVDFGDRQVFKGAQTYVCVVVLTREKKNRHYFAYTRAWGSQGLPPAVKVSVDTLAPDAWVPLVEDERRTLKKLEEGAVPLFGCPESPAARLFVGIQTPSNKIFRLHLIADEGEHLIVNSAAERTPFLIERRAVKPFLMGGDIRSYHIAAGCRWVVYPYDGAALVDLPRVAPLAAKYLARHLNYGQTPGKSGKATPKQWWAYAYPKNLGAFEQPKLLVGGVAARGRYAFDSQGKFYVAGGGDGGYSLVTIRGVDPWALLGLLSSAPLDFCLQRRSSLFSGRCFSYGRRFLRHLPIRRDALTNVVSELTREIATLLAAEPLTPSSLARARHVESEIDRKVGAAYGLVDSDWIAIRRLVPQRKF